MAEKAFKVPSLGLVGTTAELAVNTSTLELLWNTYPLADKIYVDNAVSNVTVNVEAIAGNGLVYESNSGTLAVNPGTGLYTASDAVAVNTNAIVGSGLVTDQGYITINAAALAGNGLTNSAGTLLEVNTGEGLYITSDAVAVNTNVIATRDYVDAVAQGLHIHESVRAATTANVNLANALENGDTLDGITLATNDRILVKNQTTQSENGIYVVQASGQPVRATDFDTATEVDSGDFVFVREGTVNAATSWVQTSTPAVIGTDPITFSQFAGAGTYTAGAGLSLNGSQFAINLAGTAASPTSGLEFDGTNELKVKTGTALYISANDGSLNVNTETAAASIAGNGLVYDSNSGTLAVNPGTGLYITSDAVAVNTNAIVGSGLVTDQGYITINAAALAGNGLTNSAGTLLEVNPGTGLYITSDAVAVNTNALAGNFINGSSGAFTVNIGSGLQDDTFGNIAVNTAAVASGLQSQNYGATSFFIADDNAKSINKVGHATTTDSDTWTTVATLDYTGTSDPKAFEVSITLRLPGASAATTAVRSSKISGILTAASAEYTEYAIVEVNSIPGVDVQVDANGNVQFKGTLNIGEVLTAVAETKTLAHVA